MGEARSVAVDGALTIDEVVAVAAGRARVSVPATVVDAVERGRAALDGALAAGRTLYGVNTGFGPLATTAVSGDAAEALQVNLLRSHATGTGPELPVEAVRAAIVIRLNSMGRGHSGVRPVLLERLAAVLNAGLTPCVPRTGSVGASGDLAPSAHAFLPLIGEGELRDVSGARRPAADALRDAGIEPLQLGAKEALALINGTHFMAGLGALVAEHTRVLLAAADVAAASSVEALEGCSPAFEERVQALRDVPGQARSAANIRALTAGSRRLSAGRPDRVQDPYSLRCAPQIHGAAREAAATFRRLVSADLNAVADNPLLFGDEVVSAGNFHGQTLALAFDILRLGLADLGSVSERRTFQLLFSPPGSDLPALLTRDAGVASGYIASQFTAAALVAELRQLAAPVSIDSIPTAGNQEDHVSMGMTAASAAWEACDRLKRVLAIELLLAHQAIDLVGSTPGAGVAQVHRLVRERVAPLDRDRPPAPDIEAVAELIELGALTASIEERA
jgi:histidine ammonia-lyase